MQGLKGVESPTFRSQKFLKCHATTFGKHPQVCGVDLRFTLATLPPSHVTFGLPPPPPLSLPKHVVYGLTQNFHKLLRSAARRAIATRSERFRVEAPDRKKWLTIVRCCVSSRVSVSVSSCK